MENLKNFYEKYRVYLTRPRIEIATVLLIAICAISVFLLNTPKKGVLTLDNGALVYDGTLVRGKMNGQGTMTFENGDQYTGEFNNGAFNGKGTFQSKSGWKYEGDFVNGQAEGQGKLTTEQEVVYEGSFKQGVFQQKQQSLDQEAILKKRKESAFSDWFGKMGMIKGKLCEIKKFSSQFHKLSEEKLLQKLFEKKVHNLRKFLCETYMKLFTNSEKRVIINL